MRWEDVLFRTSVETLEIPCVVSHKVQDSILKDEMHEVEQERRGKGDCTNK